MLQYSDGETVRDITPDSCCPVEIKGPSSLIENSACVCVEVGLRCCELLLRQTYSVCPRNHTLT